MDGFSRHLQAKVNICLQTSWFREIVVGKEISLSNISSNMVMFSWLCGAVVLSYAFTSSLIAALSRPALEQPMRTWQDLLDNDYVIMTSRQDFYGTMIPSTYFDIFIEVLLTLSQLMLQFTFTLVS